MWVITGHSAMSGRVRFCPDSDQIADITPRRLRATRRHRRAYSITLSARATTAGGTVMPSSFADFRLTINSNRTRRIPVMPNSKQALVVGAAAEAANQVSYGKRHCGSRIRALLYGCAQEVVGLAGG